MKLLPCSISLKVDMVKLCGGSGVTGDNLFKGFLTGNCSCRWNLRWLHLLTLTGTECYAWTLPLLSSVSKSTASQSRTVLVPDAGGRHHRHGCPPFTCGGLSSMSSPFRWQGNPSKCGVLWYELNCANDKATIQTDNEHTL